MMHTAACKQQVRLSNIGALWRCEWEFQISMKRRRPAAASGKLNDSHELEPEPFCKGWRAYRMHGQAWPGLVECGWHCQPCVQGGELMEIDVVALSGKAIKILGSRNTNGKQLYGRISNKSGISVETCRSFTTVRSSGNMIHSRLDW